MIENFKNQLSSFAILTDKELEDIVDLTFVKELKL